MYVDNNQCSSQFHNTFWLRALNFYKTNAAEPRATMSREESDKDSNGKNDKAPSKRVYRPRSSGNAEKGPEDHNLFVSVTLLRTGDVVYLNRLNTNKAIRSPIYLTSHGTLHFILDPLGELEQRRTAGGKLLFPVGCTRATSLQCRMMCNEQHDCHFYYTGSEPVGYSFDDVNITVFIATDEEEKAWNIPFEVPRADKVYTFSDDPELKADAESMAANNSDRYGAGAFEFEAQKNGKRVYEPRPPFAANAGHGLPEKSKEKGDEIDKSNPECVSS